MDFKKYKLYFRNKIELNRNLINLKAELKSVMNQDTMFVIGDSHTDIFSQNNLDKSVKIYGLEPLTELKASLHNAPDFVCYHLGACLAYNTYKKNSHYNSLKKVKFLIKSGLLPSGCQVICSFGEIDIRVHVIKQAEKQNKPVEIILKDIIDNYGRFLCFLENCGYKVVAYGPIASQKDDIKVDVFFPRYGSEIERNRITKLFNQKLETFCLINNIKFKTLFDKLVDSDMKTKTEFLSPLDNVHLRLEAYAMVKDLMSS